MQTKKTTLDVPPKQTFCCCYYFVSRKAQHLQCLLILFAVSIIIIIVIIFKTRIRGIIYNGFFLLDDHKLMTFTLFLERIALFLDLFHMRAAAQALFRATRPAFVAASDGAAVCACVVKVTRLNVFFAN